MKRNRLRCYAVLALCTLAVAFGFARMPAAQSTAPGDTANLLTIDVLSPRTGGDNPVPTVPTAGWPLTLRITATNPLGFANTFQHPYAAGFPYIDQTAYLVLSNPDGCASWFPWGFGTINPPCVRSDEVYLEFIPGDGRMEPTPPSQDLRPRLYVFSSGANTELIDVGPPGYGFGPAGRLPGLVVLSDSGVGLVLDENFNFPTTPPPHKRTLIQARNLAGFLSSVAYEINDATRHTSIVAHMSIPRSAHTGIGLFSSLMLSDNSVDGFRNACPTPQGTRISPNLYRIDGGPIQQTCEQVCSTSAIVTLRMFMVRGTAPAILQDLDGDGAVTAKDAQLAGYALLSQQAVVRVQVWWVPALFYDFDRNGKADGCQGGSPPGALTEVAR